MSIGAAGSTPASVEELKRFFSPHGNDILDIKFTSHYLMSGKVFLFFECRSKGWKFSEVKWKSSIENLSDEEMNKYICVPVTLSWITGDHVIYVKRVEIQREIHGLLSVNVHLR